MNSALNHPLWLSARAVLRAIIKVSLGAGGRLKVRRGSGLPRQARPLIVVSNHPSLMDTVYYSCALTPPVTVCGAKPRYFSSVASRTLMRLGNVMRVEGHAQYVADCTRLLEQGRILLTFPEMGRQPQGVGPFSAWTAEVALRTAVPILPCHIRHAAGKTRQAVITVGEEFLASGTADALAVQMRERIMALENS